MSHFSADANVSFPYIDSLPVGCRYIYKGMWYQKDVYGTAINLDADNTMDCGAFVAIPIGARAEFWEHA